MDPVKQSQNRSSQRGHHVNHIEAKINAGELDRRIVDSLELQRLVGGVRVPIGQESIEASAIEDAITDLDAAKIERYMQRPARQQVKELETNAYTQGNEDYNIWYNKWSGERTNTVSGRATLTPAMYKCDPDRDSGYTRASTRHSLDEAGTKYCCLFFAKGCCTLGEKCLYFHRVPTLQDEMYLDSGVDIFGRERHAKHRDDMSGVGSFMSESKTLFVGDVFPDNTEANPVDNLKDLLMEEFSKFGRVVSIKMVPSKGVAFITYDCRVVAEFAKVAMASQPLDKYSTALNVKWSHDMKSEDRRKGHDRAAFEQMVRRFESQQQVFQKHFNKQLLMQNSATKAQEEKKRRERMDKLASVLQATHGLDEDQFKVDV
ncbi:bifunctional Torus domain/RNA recognition motif domain/Nucleotide-binding alpha-beta plait domain superfamily/Pre-mRNA-splicing factor Cwc2-Slt11/Pre-mRNA-splicing factor Cwc2/RNA-binding domain superfamily/Zinc finger [Babesia duncani]|uniref:Pre-mRNA-splicing factor CWC2 n=1 Tax=Babesia duncani TaxID=323732 RepID=A0AAD9UR15_9APIC|nr:bifunctional Torus domain/RNA recognition motif domain/Nucleotide-binding alpha-beta plait domain superfamily/Pre-mRNA-splicing factor Cwc2-Slt11/Pre-mRNA-splicing factor Cwc2/RNA-binding domain superfamily/Zinc finger [Babesia duncani]